MIGILQGAATQAGADRRHEDALVVEGVDHGVPAPVACSDDAALVHANILVRHDVGMQKPRSQLGDLVVADAGRVRGYEKNREPDRRFHRILAGARDNEYVVRDVDPGRIDLGSVDDEIVPVFTRHSLGGAQDVGSAIGLRHRQREVAFAARELWKELLALRIRSVALQRHGAETDVQSVSQRDGRTVPGQLLQHDHLFHRAATGAAVFLGNCRAHQADCGHLVEQLRRELLLLVPLGDLVFRHLLLHEAPHYLLQGTLVIAESKVHKNPIELLVLKNCTTK